MPKEIIDTTGFMNEINLLKSHANEALKIAERLSQRIQLAGVSTPATRRKKIGLSDDQVATLLARKNKKRLHYTHQ